MSLLKRGTVQLIWIEINGFCKNVHISECISYNSARYLGMCILVVLLISLGLPMFVKQITHIPMLNAK